MQAGVWMLFKRQFVNIRKQGTDGLEKVKELVPEQLWVEEQWGCLKRLRDTYSRDLDVNVGRTRPRVCLGRMGGHRERSWELGR